MANKIDPVITKQTLLMAIGAAIMSGIEQLVFIIIGYWNIFVLVANLAMAAYMVLNFLFLGLTLQRAIKDPETAKKRVRISQLVRYLGIICVLAGGYFIIHALSEDLTPFFAMLPPVLFNRITILIYGIVSGKNTKLEDLKENSEVEKDNEIKG